MNKFLSFAKQALNFAGRFVAAGALPAIATYYWTSTNHHNYWNRTIFAVQTIDFKILSHTLPTKLSTLIIQNDVKEIQPTHFVGATKDINRNNHFLAKNWLVIRFAEEEIARCPKSCCKAIAQIIAEVIGDDLELRQFSGIEDLPTRKQWTEAEAAQMAADNYRQTYLAGD